MKLQSEMLELCNSEISLQLFAGGLSILALWKQGLQDKIDLLEKYFKDRRLKQSQENQSPNF